MSFWRALQIQTITSALKVGLNSKVAYQENWQTEFYQLSFNLHLAAGDLYSVSPPDTLPLKHLYCSEQFLPLTTVSEPCRKIIQSAHSLPLPRLADSKPISMAWSKETTFITRPPCVSDHTKVWERTAYREKPRISVWLKGHVSSGSAFLLPHFSQPGKATPCPRNKSHIVKPLQLCSLFLPSCLPFFDQFYWVNFCSPSKALLKCPFLCYSLNNSFP